MQISNNNLRILVSCLLLFVFIIKLTAATGIICKTQKIGILITSDNESESGNEKKDESKPAFKFHEFINFPIDAATGQVIYFTLCNPHPEFLINFSSTHYPAVLTPPPNC